jgi:hypothetical protein
MTYTGRGARYALDEGLRLWPERPQEQPAQSLQLLDIAIVLAQFWGDTTALISEEIRSPAPPSPDVARQPRSRRTRAQRMI